MKKLNKKCSVKEQDYIERVYIEIGPYDTYYDACMIGMKQAFEKVLQEEVALGPYGEAIAGILELQNPHRLYNYVNSTRLIGGLRKTSRVYSSRNKKEFGGGRFLVHIVEYKSLIWHK